MMKEKYENDEKEPENGQREEVVKKQHFAMNYKYVENMIRIFDGSGLHY